MDRIETQSTSRNTALGSDIVLREGSQSEASFLPEIVDNTGEPEAQYEAVSSIKEEAK